MNSLYSYLLIVFHHEILVDSSKAQIVVSLCIKHASNSRLVKQVNIILRLRIWTEPYTGVADLVKTHVVYKICISFFNVTVDNEDRENIPL